MHICDIRGKKKIYEPGNAAREESQLGIIHGLFCFLFKRYGFGCYMLENFRIFFFQKHSVDDYRWARVKF